MHTLQAPSAVSKYTGAFETTHDSEVWVDVTSTFGGGTITMQMSRDKGTTWVTFTPEGVDETFTTATQKMFDLMGGYYWRFLNDGTADSTVCYVGGNAINVNVQDSN